TSCTTHAHYYTNQLQRICYFFFQAEDGIRDSSVTGVQTCALPISARTRNVEVPDLRDEQLVLKGAGQYAAMCANCHLAPQQQDRSEERRVGKECRSRWARYE